MAKPLIPDHVRRFIVSNVPTIPHLEAILLLRGSPGRSHSCALVAERLYIAEKVAAAVMGDLLSSGIVALATEAPQNYLYAPSSEMLRRTVDDLATCYANHLVDITNLIHAKNSKKAQQFANAFKWRKE
jgi:hypothetical protein